MISLKTIRTPHFNASLYYASASSSISSNSSKSVCISSIFQRPFSRSAQPAPNADENIRSFTQPLSGFFRKLFFGEEKAKGNRVVAENVESEERNSGDRLRKLEEEVRHLNKERCETLKNLQQLSEKVEKPTVAPKVEKRSLSALFAGVKGLSKSESKPKSASKSPSEAKSESKPVDRTAYGMEDPMVHRELTPDMKLFVEHLYVKRYMKNANFLPRSRFDSTYFEVGYAREFVKFAASNFGGDHQEIARWLSAGDLKKIALFGCPNLGQRTVYAAKHMRSFFRIDEHKVCQACILKETCRHRNKPCMKDSAKLRFDKVIKVLIMYAMESVPKKLVVPEEVKHSVNRLLKETISLSQETRESSSLSQKTP